MSNQSRSYYTYRHSTVKKFNESQTDTYKNTKKSKNKKIQEQKYFKLRQTKGK